MNKFDVFPKKLTILGLTLLLTVFILLMNMLAKGRDFVTTFYTRDVPGLQLYCGASRLVAINKLLQDTHSTDIATLQANQQGLLFSMEELIKLGTETLPGSVTEELQSSINQAHAKLNNHPNKVLPSQKLEILEAGMQDFIEKYLQRRNQLLERQMSLSNYIVTGGIVGIILFFALMFYVYRLYRRNIVALELLTARVEKQRQTTVQSAKLASLGEMAASMAHEINNPLAIIAMTAKMMDKQLAKEPLNMEQLKSCLHDIEVTVPRISKIINGLRNLSRDSSNEPLQACRVKEIFDDVLGISSERFKNHGVELRIEDPLNLMEASLPCQRIQLSQVLLNLLGNAFDAVHTLEERRVTITLGSDGHQFTLAITDSGEGIPDTIRQKIFQPFFTTKEIGKGTGLGLSISKTIIESHRGRLYLDPNTPKTRFVVEVPWAQTHN